MRPVIDDTRSTLTEAQVIDLIKSDASIEIGRGMELVNRRLEVLDDVSADLRDCTITHDNSATLHSSAQFAIAQRLAWGSSLVRPYVTISNGSLKARFNMGVYFTEAPENEEDRTPATYAVGGYDILKGLNNLVGDSYAVRIGDSYLDAVESIFLNQGYTQYVIDPTRRATLAPAPKAWPIDENTTWLMIVNELLKAVGYKGVYSDWDGRLVCEEFIEPRDRSVEWSYDKGLYTGQLVPGTKVRHDYFITPNRWVGIRNSTQDTTGTVSLTEGNGVFTYRNESSGEASIDARGFEQTKVIRVDVADQPALESAVMAEVARDMVIGMNIDASTSCNPLHWHDDVVRVETSTIGIIKVRQSTWSMNLTKGAMSHGWSVL